MNTDTSQSAAPGGMTDLFRLTLADGLKATADGHELRYKTVLLRETNVGDERAAQRLAERLVHVGGVPKLVVSDADFRFALTMRHIEAFECDGQSIPLAALKPEMLDKLSTHDLGLIEQRIVVIDLAAEVRYGNLSQADFEALVSGVRREPAAAPHSTPQRGGQVEAVGPRGSEPEPGPALLADYVGDAAHGQAQGHGA